MKQAFLLTCFFIAASTLKAQLKTAPVYPQGYFRNPLDIPILLAGNFGECRPNHFHSGIDIKTTGKENLPVHAAAEGYISRIKMERGGFGHALYVTHPNGFTTLYAHLNNFMPDVQRYVKSEQYKKESWELDLVLPSSKFPVVQGQQIAWSGNTGASTAPHLHFEIRDNKTEHPLNPQLFGFEVNDKIAPVPTQVAVYDLSLSLYEQEVTVTALKKKGTVYTTADTITAYALQAGLGINVNDYMDGSDNTLAFYTAAIYMDSIWQGSITLDDIGYEETRYLHAYADYKYKKNTGNWIQLLFQLKGNELGHIYEWKGNNGLLDISDGNAHEINIVLTDAGGNTSTILFALKGGNSAMACEKTFKAGKPNPFEHPNVSFSLNERALYDDVCFRFSKISDQKSYSDRYSLHDASVPVHTYFDLRLKPNKAIGFGLKDKIALVYSDGKEESGKATTYDGGWYKAPVRNFGDYRLVADTVPPVIKAMQKQNALLTTAKRISFTANDAITNVKSFRATLNGKWLCFEQRGNVFFYIFDEYCPKGKQIIVATATDENGNKQTLNYTFTR